MGSLFRAIALCVSLSLIACTAVDSNPKTLKPASSNASVWPDFMPTLMPAISASPEPAALTKAVLTKLRSKDESTLRTDWAGVWSGWGGRGRVVGLALALDQVTQDSASLFVVRTVEKIPKLEHSANAKFEGDELVAPLPSGTVMRYRLRNANTMEFVWSSPNGKWMAGLLTRSNPSATMSKTLIPTDLLENGDPVALEAVIYRPEGEGPFPILVFNHGSTGVGSNPKLFTETWAEPNVGRWFTERGWMVVFPQRRGRGKSGGRYAEGLEADGSGYSTRPEVSLPGLDRALTDIDAVVDWLGEQAVADTSQMLMGGQSRGGVLGLVYVASRPNVFLGALNFVGGWMGDRLPVTRDINRQTFERAGKGKSKTLWLYADQDPFYSLEHSRSIFAAFIASGGSGEFHALPVQPGQNGHSLIADSSLWGSLVDKFLAQLNQ